jgi:putative SOS response-associated peptidase YedK
MCGRFTLKTPADQFAEAFGPVAVEFAPGPRYNIAPTQPVSAILNDGRRAITACRWGLIPAWARDPAAGGKMINARSETVAVKPSFRSAFERRRCLILADGFYEWKKPAGGGRKIPHYIRLRSGLPFAFAGVWEDGAAPDGGPARSCAILTTEANALMATLHDRMPVILPRSSHALWLDPGSARPPDRWLELLRPCPDGELEAYPVSDRVNRVRVDDPRCIEPAASSRPEPGELF